MKATGKQGERTLTLTLTLTLTYTDTHTHAHRHTHARRQQAWQLRAVRAERGGDLPTTPTCRVWARAYSR